MVSVAASSLLNLSQRWTKDPRNLPKIGLNVPNQFYVDNGTSVAVNDAGYWAGTVNTFGATGAFTTASFTGGTYATILTVSGHRGVVSFMVGPVTPNSNDVTDFEVTVDGVLTVVSLGNKANYFSRVGLGFVRALNTAGITTSNVDAQAFNAPDLTSSTFDAQSYSPSAGSTYMSPAWAITMGVPVLFFSTSLLVRIRVTTSQSTATSRNAGVQYMLLD